MSCGLRMLKLLVWLHLCSRKFLYNFCLIIGWIAYPEVFRRFVSDRIDTSDLVFQLGVGLLLT